MQARAYGIRREGGRRLPAQPEKHADMKVDHQGKTGWKGTADTARREQGQQEEQVNGAKQRKKSSTEQRENELQNDSEGDATPA